MDREEFETPLPITDRLERVQILLAEARDELSVVWAQEHTREFNIQCQRARRAGRRDCRPNESAPLLSQRSA